MKKPCRALLAFSEFIRCILVRWRWPTKRPEAFGFALIFFVFLYQDKKEKKILFIKALSKKYTCSVLLSLFCLPKKAKIQFYCCRISLQ